MAMTYSRSMLLSMKYWWRNTQNIKPLLLTDWNACKKAGILRSTRGKRGGVKLQGTCTDIRTNQISVIDCNRRQSNSYRTRARKIQFPSVNYGNLLNIQTCPTITRSKINSVTDLHESWHFVPSILLSNTMSLMPKIDEVAHTMNIIEPDIGVFTETWLSESVPDDPININGYQLYRRDRVNRLHGGVCRYVKTSIKCKVLSELYNVDHEVLWVDLTPKRLPRGFSNVIVGVVYHPPGAHDATMKEYIISSLETVESKYPNCAIILAGDFNKSLLPTLQTTVN